MFGLASFSQVPFDTIPPNSYVLAISEGFSVAESESISANLSQSITENFRIFDDNSESGTIFYFGITEISGVNDTPVIHAQFVETRTEPFTSNNTQAIAAQFAVSKSENTSIADTYSTYFALTEALSEPINSVLSIQTIRADYKPIYVEPLRMAETEAIAAQFAVSRVENFFIESSPTIRGWIKINDNQSITWTGVNDTSGSTWSTVSNTQNPGWNPVDDSQG